MHVLRLEKICRIIGVVTILNFLIFVVISIIIGGDAVNGHVEMGRYFLSNHGQLTEVSYPVFVYSKIHVYSLFVTFPAWLIASIIYWNIKGKNRLGIFRK